MKLITKPLGIAWAICLSIPFYFLWNWLAPVYLPNLAPVYTHLPFFHTVGLFGLVAIIKLMILP